MAESEQKHRYRLGRAFSLGKNKNHQYVYRKGRSIPCRYMVLIYLRHRDMKVGFSVSAKVGNAVTRNHLRRIMREDFRLMRPQLKAGKYIFVARVAAHDATHDEMTSAMRLLVRRAQLLCTEGK